MLHAFSTYLRGVRGSGDGGEGLFGKLELPDGPALLSSLPGVVQPHVRVPADDADLGRAQRVREANVADPDWDADVQKIVLDVSGAEFGTGVRPVEVPQLQVVLPAAGGHEAPFRGRLSHCAQLPSLLERGKVLLALFGTRKAVLFQLSRLPQLKVNGVELDLFRSLLKINSQTVLTPTFFVLIEALLDLPGRISIV